MLVTALAALAVSAHGVQPTPAQAHRKAGGRQTGHHVIAHKYAASGAAHSHEKAGTLHRSVTAHPAGHAAVRSATETAGHKPTPEEVGRAAGLKIRNQLNRRAAIRHTRVERHRPELVRASYTPVRASGSVEESPAEAEIDEQPSSQPESEAMSGTTHYQSVNAQSEASHPAENDFGRSEETRTATIPGTQTEMADREPASPISVPRRNAIPRPAASSAPTDGSDAMDSEDGDTSDAPSPASPNAVHPAFARHVASPAPDALADTDVRSAPAREAANENAGDYNTSEDKRLKAETEQASLTIAGGYMPAPLRGNRASLERQNERLEAEGLERIEDEDDLASRIAHHLLVPVPVSEALTVNGNLPANHRYCRPWTARFLSDLANAHDAEFHRPLEVSSAVRTVEYQKKLMMVNGNAAPAEGDVVSPHMTGATIDIAKDNLSRAEMAWMRRHLLAMEAAGKIDVEEEFLQSCFHITVYKNYMPAYHPAPRRQAPSQAHTGKGHPVHTEAADGNSTQGV